MQSDQEVKLVLEPQKAGGVLGIIAAVLTLNHVAIRMAEFVFFREDQPAAFRFYAYLFTVNAEGVVPTAFSMLSLMFCAALLFVIGVAAKNAKRPFVWQWIFLALVFFFLAIDEGFEIHERTTDNVREALDTGGLLYNAWVIPYGALLIVFLTAYTRFIVRLPNAARSLFVVAGALYVFGAIGMELVGGGHAELYGTNNPGYAALTTIEEVLEMAGIVTFAYGLLTYLRSEITPSPTVSISFVAEPPRRRPSKRIHQRTESVPAHTS